MEPQRWQQIEEIFHEALELDGPQRLEFLKKQTGGDDDLLSEVEKLLSQFDNASKFSRCPMTPMLPVS